MDYTDLSILFVGLSVIAISAGRLLEFIRKFRSAEFVRGQVAGYREGDFKPVIRYCGRDGTKRTFPLHFFSLFRPEGHEIRAWCYVENGNAECLLPGRAGHFLALLLMGLAFILGGASWLLDFSIGMAPYVLLFLLAVTAEVAGFIADVRLMNSLPNFFSKQPRDKNADPPAKTGELLTYEDVNAISWKQGHSLFAYVAATVAFFFLSFMIYAGWSSLQ